MVHKQSQFDISEVHLSKKFLLTHGDFTPQK